MTKRKLRVGLISSYVPMKCGIATHSRDLLESMYGNQAFDWRLIAAEDIKGPYEYQNKPLAILKKGSLETYKLAAKAMNDWQPDVVLLAHEYGLFGGSLHDIQHSGQPLRVITGDLILTLIDALKAPIITTLHTIIPDPDNIRRDVMRSISKKSSKLVTMTDDGLSTLDFFYGIDKDHVAVIPHGVPHPVQREKQCILDELGLDKKRFYMLITGLIGPNKGIDHVIKALPEIIKKHPGVTLLVVGQTHPTILEEVGEVYREGLISLATELGICDYVQFVNEYLPIDRLVDYLTIADVYLTIHRDPEQAASGTLAYALGCGLASISTPYRYAKEVLADGRGFLVPFNNSSAIADQVDILIENKALLKKTKEKALAFGSSMSWAKVGAAYMNLVEAIIRE